MRLLMVAADRREFTGIVARAEDARPATVAADWARSARMGEHQLLLVANGAGGKRAAAAVDAGLAAFDAEAIVSTGFCGALAEGLDVADIVTGTTVTDGAQNFEAIAPECARQHRKGVIRSIDHVAQTAGEKRQLRAEGGDAVEMEAAGVAEKAVLLGLPFYCIRVVTDLAGEDMANDFNGALRADGHFDTMVILRGTLRAPLVLLPELIRLRNRCARSALVLGEFIADCRF